MSLMMPDGKSWTTSLPATQGSKNSQPPDSYYPGFNPATQNQYGQPLPGQGGIPSDAIFRKNSQQPAAPQTKQSGSMDFSAYAPGKAQPTQTPSLGSAYSPSNQGLVWNQTEQAYLPPAQQPTQRPAPQQPAMQQPTSMQAGVYGPGGEYYGANQSQGLADAMRQRDAFVQQSMQAIMPYQVANFTKQDFGAPQIDLQGLRNAASQMTQDGFYNPFTKYFEQQQQQTMAPEFLNPYAPPSLYGNPYFMPPANPYFMPQMNPYFMQAPPSLYGPQNTSMPRGNVDPNLPSDTGWWGMGPQPSVQADPYQDFISSLPGFQPRDQWMTKQARPAPPLQQPAPGRSDLTIDPRYTPPASPGGRYTPVAPREDSQTKDMRPQYDNADRFIRELTRTNPATWTEAQWADYERAQRDTGLMDGGGYYRDQQGNVRYGGGYGPADRPADPTIGRDSRQDQYGTWGGSGGGSYSPQRPGTAQPIQPPSQGTPYMPTMPTFGAPSQPAPPKKDPGQEFNERLFKRDANLKQARREGKVLDVNGNFISPKNLPPDLYADWLKTRRPQY
jgi:hypothetical protein